MVKKYIVGMKNADAQAGEILWGGEIEIHALANLFECRIEIYRESAINDEPIKYGEEENVVVKLVYCNGNHYKFIKPGTKNEIVDVKPDGNCLFYAYLGAIGQEQSVEEVGVLRDTITDYISDDESLCASIRMMFEAAVNAENVNSFDDALTAIPLGSLRDQVEIFVIPKLMKLVKDSIKQTNLDETKSKSKDMDADVALFGEFGDGEAYIHESQPRNPFVDCNVQEYTEDADFGLVGQIVRPEEPKKSFGDPYEVDWGSKLEESENTSPDAFRKQ